MDQQAIERCIKRGLDGGVKYHEMTVRDHFLAARPPVAAKTHLVRLPMQLRFSGTSEDLAQGFSYTLALRDVPELADIRKTYDTAHCMVVDLRMPALTNAFNVPASIGTNIHWLNMKLGMRDWFMDAVAAQTTKLDEPIFVARSMALEMYSLMQKIGNVTLEALVRDAVVKVDDTHLLVPNCSYLADILARKATPQDKLLAIFGTEDHHARPDAFYYYATTCDFVERVVNRLAATEPDDTLAKVVTRHTLRRADLDDITFTVAGIDTAPQTLTGDPMEVADADSEVFTAEVELVVAMTLRDTEGPVSCLSLQYSTSRVPDMAVYNELARQAVTPTGDQ